MKYGKKLSLKEKYEVKLDSSKAATIFNDYFVDIVKNLDVHGSQLAITSDKSNTESIKPLKLAIFQVTNPSALTKEEKTTCILRCKVILNCQKSQFFFIVKCKRTNVGNVIEASRIFQFFEVQCHNVKYITNSVSKYP